MSESDLPRPIINSNGNFENPWGKHEKPSFWKYIQFSLQHRKPKIPSKEELDIILPVLKPNFEALKNFPGKFLSSIAQIQTTWIGHATFFVQMEEGVNYLTDPHFSDRASPFSFAGPKRYRPLPLQYEELPKTDFVLVSHDHYDHLDEATVLKIGNSAKWYVPLGLKKWFNKRGITNVTEMDWWQTEKFNDKVKITATPTDHWSKRHLFKSNDSLWNSYVVEGQRTKTFFAGDTAYCSVFSLIGRMFGPFNLAMLPIGSYHPREQQAHSHVDPYEAVQMHIDLKSMYSVGMHFGTFLLTCEKVDDPVLRLREALRAKEIHESNFFALKHGETRIISGTK